MTSTGIFAADGIDISALVAEHLGPRVLPAVLHKPGAKAECDPDDPTAAPQPGPPTDHPCRGFVEDYSPALIDGNLILAGDRKVILLGGTLDVEPEGGQDRDTVTIEGTLYRVWSVRRDPAAATFTLQVRKP